MDAVSRPAKMRNCEHIFSYKSAVAATILSIMLAGCGGDSGGSRTTSNGLWVANRNNDTVAGFSSSVSRHSGSPIPTSLNGSLSLALPEGLIFDKHHNMWVSNCSGSENLAGSIDKFTPSQLRSLRKNPAPTPDVELLDDGAHDVFNCPYGLEFDTSGNLWVVNRFEPDLISFTPDQLEQGGVVLPNTTIFSFHFGDPEDLQFDQSGTLWIADASFPAFYAFKSATLAAAAGKDNLLEPDIIITSAPMDTPAALAFDKDDNLWIANCGFKNTILEFSASQLGTSGNLTPTVTLDATEVTTATGTALSLDCPEGLTFDRKGDLWVSNALSDTFGSLAKFTKSQLAASGSPAPSVFLDADAGGINLNQPVLIDFGPL